MKELNVNQLENLEGGRKFWGTQCGTSYSIEEGSCYQNCTHYVFWINNGTEYGVPC
jgi:hypothetical protein